MESNDISLLLCGCNERWPTTTLICGLDSGRIMFVMVDGFQTGFTGDADNVPFLSFLFRSMLVLLSKTPLPYMPIYHIKKTKDRGRERPK